MTACDDFFWAGEGGLASQSEQESLFLGFAVPMLAGVLTLRDVRAILIKPAAVDQSITAADLMIRNVVTVYENDHLEDAFHLFSSHLFLFCRSCLRHVQGRLLAVSKKKDYQLASDLLCRLPYRP